MVHLRERALFARSETRARGAPEVGAPGMPGPEPIDRTHLSRYTLGSATLEREIIGLFLAQLPLSIEQLRFAATDREWQIAAHTIKGSARSVGAWHIARLAEEAEKTSGVTDEAVRERVLATLEAAGEAVESYVAVVFPADATRG